MLQISSLTKRYGATPALEGISLQVEPGEFVGLLGPNGAGKSTLMSLIACLATPDAGEIRLNGKLLCAQDAIARQQLGLVPQTLALYEDLTAEENLRVFGALYGLRGRLLTERVDEALQAAGLVDRRRDRVNTFSGGMQRRLNLVASLLHRPALLLCDEPTVGVDPQSRNSIFEYLEQRNAEGLTIIYSTHYMEEASKLCSRIAVMDHGRILANGTLDRLLTLLPTTERLHLPATPVAAGAAAELRRFGNVSSDAEGHLVALSTDVRLSEVFATLERHHVPPSDCRLSRPTLEDVFLQLTGKSLRE